MLKTRYNIDTTPRGLMSPVAPNVITIPRICACFPHKICDIFDYGFGKILCSFDDLGIIEHKEISKSILCTFSPALIPTETVTANKGIHLLFFIVQIINDTILHRKDKSNTDLEDMFTYYAASYRSAGTPQKSKVEYLVLKKILTPGTHLLLPQIADAIKGAAGRIRQ